MGKAEEEILVFVSVISRESRQSSCQLEGAGEKFEPASIAHEKNALFCVHLHDDNRATYIKVQIKTVG